MVGAMSLYGMAPASVLCRMKCSQIKMADVEAVCPAYFTAYGNDTCICKPHHFGADIGADYGNWITRCVNFGKEKKKRLQSEAQRRSGIWDNPFGNPTGRNPN